MQTTSTLAVALKELSTAILALGELRTANLALALGRSNIARLALPLGLAIILSIATTTTLSPALFCCPCPPQKPRHRQGEPPKGPQGSISQLLIRKHASR